MATAATCPRCGRSVSLPVGATPSSQVRCPMCQSEFRLQEALDFNPPVLEVVAKSAKQTTTTVEVPPSAAEAAAERLAAAKAAREKPDQSMPDLLGNSAQEPWEFSPGGADQKRAGVSTPNRSTGGRRQRNPVVEMVKIVLGGFLGLAVGYGILLWGFKTDPFNFARYLPAAIVPDSVATPDAMGAGKDGK